MPTIQNRRATASQWTAANPVLAAGELGFELDTNRIKIGDGLKSWTALTYFSEEALDNQVMDLIKTSLPVEIEKSASVYSSKEQLLREKFLVSKGGRIGTGGAMPISIRFDHWTNVLGDTILPMLEARGMPSGLCVYSRFLTPDDTYYDADSNKYGWSALEDWCLHRGVELWSHGRSHSDTPHAGGEDALREEIVFSKVELEAAMPRVKIQGWMQPGVTALAGPGTQWMGFDTTNLDHMYSHLAGRLIRQTYPVSELDMWQAIRTMPGRPLHGAGHVTIDSLTYADLDARLTLAVNSGYGVEFMLHPGLVGKTASNITMADFTAFLDRLVVLRDSGKIDIITPSAMYVADPSFPKTSRTQLIRGGTFKDGFDPVSNPGAWNATSATTLVPDGSVNWLRIPSTGSVFNQTAASVHNLELRGEMFAMECTVRRSDNLTPAVARMIVADTLNANMLNKTWTFVIPEGVHRFVRFFSIPQTETRNLRFNFGRQSGGGVDVTDCKVYKV